MAASPAFAQLPSVLSEGIDRRTLRTQEMVESLFLQGEELAAQGEHKAAHFNFKRAHSIYKNDLAPVGDKYAQYMVGFMYFTGTGVDEDAVLASAWYRLAAESSYPELLAVRDQVLDTLTDIDKIRSDQLYLQLRSQYSDVVLLLRLIKDDLDDIRRQTGTRTSGRSGPVTIVDPRSGRSISGDEYARRLEQRLDSFMDLMAKHVDVSSIDRNYDHFDITSLENIVHNYVHDLNDR